MGEFMKFNLAKRFFYFTILSGIITSMLMGCGEKEIKKEEVARPAKMMTISANNQMAQRTYPGKVRASQRAKLAFQVTGKIIKFPVKSGEKVKKDQLLAQLDQRDFINDLEAKKAIADDAKANYERYKTLWEKKATSKAEFEKKKMDYEVAKSNTNISAKALEDTTIKAPFDGVIADKYVENFENIQAKQDILSIQDVSEIEVLIDIPERVMVNKQNKPKKGASVEAEFQALPGKKFNLVLKEFSTEADPETQTYQVVLAMPAPKDAEILPGMTAKVFHISNIYGHSNGTFIPVESVFDDDGKTYVWIVNKSSRAEKREVKTGKMSGQDIQIMQGLNREDKIITAGVHFVVPGMLVKPLLQKTGE
jgi:RND family efflux transporter MFP subunit